jgi:hypothetical protein
MLRPLDRTLPPALYALAILLSVSPNASSVWAAQDATAEDWLRKSQAARFPAQDQRARFVILIEQSDGTMLKRKGMAYRRTRSDGLADRLFVVRSPDSLSGLALLSKDRAAGPAVQWLYVPTYRRARRVAIHGAGDAFVGSDFTYADFGRVRIEAGTHRLSGEETVGGRPCVMIETMNQHPTLPYAKLISALDRVQALPLRTEYYDEHGRLTRVGSLDEIVEIDGWPTPVRITMTNEVDGGHSTIKLVDVRYNVGIEPGLFTVENLEKTGPFE